MSILEVADRITSSDRQADYGHPLDDFQGSADILRVLVRRRYGVDIEFTPDFIGLLMAIAIKGNRQAGKHKEDNLIDICGYTRTMEMCHEETERRDNEQRAAFGDQQCRTISIPVAVNDTTAGNSAPSSRAAVAGSAQPLHGSSNVAEEDGA